MALNLNPSEIGAPNLHQCCWLNDGFSSVFMRSFFIMSQVITLIIENMNGIIENSKSAIYRHIPY